jgi:glycosyltransferase involved in cell wall biosynthesis
MSDEHTHDDKDKTRRALFVLPVGEQGGAESLWLDFFRVCDRRRVSPSVVFLRPGPLVDALARLRVETFLQPITRVRDPLNYARTVWAMRGIIARTRAEVVFSSLGYGHLYGGMAARLAHRPAVWWQHGIASEDNLIDRWAGRIPARMIVTSSQTARLAQVRLLAGARDTVRLIYPGVDVERFAAPDAERVTAVRRELDLNRASHVVATIGRLQRGKGQDDFLRAAGLVRNSFPAVKFLVVGSEMFGMSRGYDAELRRMAVDLGLGEEVVFTGFRRDIPEILAVSDIIVQPARYPESFGLVLCEAAAAAKPVIATDVGGPREIIVDGRTGVLVPPGDPRVLAAAICDLLNDAHRRWQMGRWAAERARTLFDIRRMAEDVYRVIEDAVSI